MTRTLLSTIYGTLLASKCGSLICFDCICSNIRLNKGEPVNIKEKLGTGNPEKEKRWKELFEEMESSKEYFYRKERNKRDQEK